MSHITTHVLDASRGKPAARVPVRLEDPLGTLIATSVTDADGRVSNLGPDRLPVGAYRLIFDTAAYFSALETTSFYPSVTIDFSVTDVDSHYHVPLLLSPFAYSTYRGS